MTNFISMFDFMNTAVKPVTDFVTNPNIHFHGDVSVLSNALKECYPKLFNHTVRIEFSVEAPRDCLECTTFNARLTTEAPYDDYNQRRVEVYVPCDGAISSYDLMMSITAELCKCLDTMNNNIMEASDAKNR